MLLNVRSLETPPIVYAYAPAAGGSALGGAADVARTRAVAAAGGISAGPSATAADVARVRAWTAAGGMTGGGNAAAVARIRAAVAAGGLAVAGDAGVVRVRDYSAGGGVAIAGGRLVARVRAAPTTAAGLTAGGDGAGAFAPSTPGGPATFAYSASGGVGLGGAAACELIPEQDEEPEPSDPGGASSSWAHLGGRLVRPEEWPRTFEWVGGGGGVGVGGGAAATGFESGIPVEDEAWLELLELELV